MTWTAPSPTVYCKVSFTERSVVAFDFDDSLVKRGTSDPLAGVIDRLREFAKDHDLVVFSNQKGISTGKATASEIQRLMDEFSERLEPVPVSFFFSTSSDLFRKPAPGMYKLAKSMGMGSVLWYAGDASGRVGDFSASDLYFAHNTHVKYVDIRDLLGRTVARPVGTKPALSIYRDDIWKEGILQNPRKLRELGTDHTIDTDLAIEVESMMNSDSPVFSGSLPLLVLMVGPQGSGKSQTAKTLADADSLGIGAQIINGDTLKTMTKMKSRFRTLVRSGCKLVVIDNTNAKKDTRAAWRDAAAEFWGTDHFRTLILWFNLTKDATFHAIGFRTAEGGADVPDVAVHTYFKYLEPPTAEEGTIIEINSVVTPFPERFHNFRAARGCAPARRIS